MDLYGAQVGGRLEDMASFQKYIGGSPTNMAAGMARLGLKSALITRVGNEHMGRFIREELVREGVDVQGVKTDPDRLTALVLLGIRDEEELLYESEIKKHAKYVACVSQPKGDWNGFRGRVTDYLRNLGGDFHWNQTEYYLCGAGQMIDEVRAILTERGVEKDSIHREIYFKQPKPTP